MNKWIGPRLVAKANLVEVNWLIVCSKWNLIPIKEEICGVKHDVHGRKLNPILLNEINFQRRWIQTDWIGAAAAGISCP